jgi:hypothetical protein
MNFVNLDLKKITQNKFPEAKTNFSNAKKLKIKYKKISKT